MRTAVVVLLCVVVAPLNGVAQDSHLSTDDLSEIQAKIASASDYLDNEFVYEEKVSELTRDVEEYSGRPVRIVVAVVRVTKELVQVESPLERAATPSRRYPQIAVIESADVDVPWPSGSQPQGRARLTEGVWGRPAARPSSHMILKVGELVPLELAKLLRKGDRLQLSGKLAAVSIRDDLTAEFIIVDAEVEKVSEERE